MGTAYGQFCPVAKAMELLDERWTMLLVRELVTGSEHFNDLRRGLPRMSPSLLSKRLHQLVRAGIVDKQVDGTDVRYLLTPAGLELRPVVEAVGTWGARWITEIGDRELDPKLLLWDMHRHVDTAATPPGRTVVHFCFPEISGGEGRWWLLLDGDDVEVCDDDPGQEPAVTVTTSLRTLTEIWLGRLSWDRALRGGDLELAGAAHLRRSLPAWFELSTFAGVPPADTPVRG